MKILYVNAMTDLEGGETYAAGLRAGFEASQAFAEGRNVEWVHYNLFYESAHSKVMPARQMGYFARLNGIRAVVLSGSAKNTSDIGDPFFRRLLRRLKRPHGIPFEFYGLARPGDAHFRNLLWPSGHGLCARGRNFEI